MAETVDIRVSKTTKRSIINKYFTTDLLIEIERISLANASNNAKGKRIKELMKEHGIPFEPLGNGTNRMGFLLDGYAVKVALDHDGKTDNCREMLYTKPLQPYVVKVYECLPNGLLAVSEYVEIFDLDSLYEKRSEMISILKDISDNFLIGDVGISKINYVNWGTRSDGTICIMDFAYIYDTKLNTFSCNCSEDAILSYDSNYNNLICPLCGRKYEFGEVRRRITRKQQENEIGDIRRLGYLIHGPEETVPINPEFEPKRDFEKKKKKLSPEELEIKEYRKWKKEEDEFWETNSVEDEDY